VTGNTQVAIDTVSMANNDGTNFRPLSGNVVTLSLCGRAHALVTIGPNAEHADSGGEAPRSPVRYG